MCLLKMAAINYYLVCGYDNTTPRFLVLLWKLVREQALAPGALESTWLKRPMSVNTMVFKVFRTTGLNFDDFTPSETFRKKIFRAFLIINGSSAMKFGSHIQDPQRNNVIPRIFF